ncbi:MAG: HlyD family secretion protein, partial [Planctomycetaceae bacterium]|nr:HlyD family secretion protein [Planctomycetaceae bacterium]
FNMPGVIAFQNAQTAKLGERITAIELETKIYKLMEADAKTARTQGLADLAFNAEKIKTTLDSGTLFAIRNKSLGVALDQKLLQRKNMFLEQYKHQALLIKKLKEMYKGGTAVPPDNATGANPKTKQQRLGTLIAASQDKFNALKKAYGTQGVQGTSQTDVTYNGRIVTKSKTLGSGVQIQGHQTHVHEDNPPAVPKQILVHHTNKGTPIGYNAKDKKWEDIAETGYPSSEHSLQYLDIAEKNEGGDKGFKQTSTTSHREFVYPRRDALIRFLRTQLDLMDEQLAEEMYGNLVNNDLDAVMKNELEMIDNEVMKLQLNLVHTFLTSPVDGLVTAIYKDLGESVTAGEPVLRVEDDSTVLLVGRLRNTGPIRVGATA